MYQVSASHADQLHVAVSRQRNRNRGVMLSDLGWQKLIQARVSP